MSGVLLAKVFGRQDHEIARYRDENDRQTALQIRQTMSGQSFFAVVTGFFALIPAVVYLVAGLLAAGGDAGISAGTLVAFTTLQTRLLFPIVNLLRVSLDVQTSLALFGRIFEYLDLTPVAARLPRRPGRWPRPTPAARSSSTTSGSATPATSGATTRPRRWALRGPVAADRARAARRGRRAERSGQDHAVLPGPAALRRRRGRGAARRRRRARPDPGLAAGAGRHGDPGELPVPRARSPTTCATPRPDATDEEIRRRRPRREHRRAHRVAARGLRHDGRRARLPAVRRREAAGRDRPGDPVRPAASWSSTRPPRPWTPRASASSSRRWRR